MVLAPEEIADLKAQLSQQIQNLPSERKAAAQHQIDSLSPEALESMIEEQKRHSPELIKKKEPPQDIFRKIVAGQIPSVKIDENKEALAVLDIVPISKGHTIIIPKLPVPDAKQIPTQCFTLAKKISSKIVSKLKAKSTEIQTEKKFGETIINIIPSYESPLNINSPRTQEDPSSLEPVAKLLRPVIKTPVIKSKKKAPESKILKLDRRIP